MATSGGRKKVGITNHPIKQEQENQDRLPPRGKAKEGTGVRKGSLKRRTELFTPKGDSPQAGAAIGSKGNKGGRTSGSKAGLVSFKESKRVSKGKALSEKPPGHRNRVGE